MVGLSKKPVVPITVHTFNINATFADGASIIGGSVTIDGVVLLGKQESTQGDDGGGVARFEVNGVDVVDSGLTDDGDVSGLMTSFGGGLVYDYFGMLEGLVPGNGAVPHTTFDIKNRQGSISLFHRTIKVVVLNRS